MNASTTYQEQLTTVTRKGQITVPASIRSALGIKEGDKVALRLTAPAAATLRPVRSVTAMTFGVLASAHPMLSPPQERAAFAAGAAEEVAAEEAAHSR